ncbi:MAG: bacteriohemerythrin [gamma proteobacterium symbiont of Bathyaustriella thionipta]|nr:bacteriohemerythrin [gamma proteobacterium symbiont of Bathyaustriella thionipta]
MSRIEWSDEMKIGIAVIDGQHRRIFDYIKQLEGVEESNRRETVAEVIELMLDYTLSHFAFEEALMEEAGYEYLEVHRGTHQAFSRQINALKQRFGSGDDVAQDVSDMLHAWLTNHIMDDDKSYAALVKSKFSLLEDKKGGWLSQAVQRYFG